MKKSEKILSQRYKYMKIKIIAILTFWMIVISSPAGFCDELLLRLSDGYKNVKIERVIKSDFIILDNGKKVHLIGIKVFDQPRRKNLPTDQYGFVIEETTTDPTTSVEEKASDFAKEIMENKKVRVELDVKTIDNDGLVLGYVFLPDGKMANAEILRQGFAELHIQPPNLKYADQLREAYREARAEKRGIHANQ
jgi:micrococcal nuclease